MSSSTPPVPPLPEQPAAEAARTPQPPTGATQTSSGAAVDPDDTGVPTSLKGGLDDIGRGFFSALFDVSFRTFITRRLASVFYIVGLIVIAIGFLVYFVTGLVNGIRLLQFNVGGGVSLLVATVVLVPLATFLAIIVLRFVIEAVVALIAIAENTERTAQHTER
ncbi:DUF4282 domain-containing protein [Microbacterium deminutum]|uniref:DUF4282 domain-containing protein n=1 Tax=Microbacterium deminutum TaxID=344164 RepID=A0ABN2Q9H2_9MICO